MSKLVKNAKRAILILVSLVGLILVIHLAYAAYSGTKRLLGPETVFESVTATGTITFGTSATDGSLKFYCHDNPPTCDAAARGQIYCDDSESRLKYCDGTSWTTL